MGWNKRKSLQMHQFTFYACSARRWLLLLIVTCGAIEESPCADICDSARSAAASAENVTLLFAKIDLRSAESCAQDVLDSQMEPSHMASIVEAVARHPDCVREMERSATETRCAQRWYKVVISILANAGDTKAGEASFHRAREVGIQWPSAEQTPTVWIPGLTTAPVWECSHWNFLSTLESRASEILMEVEAVSANLSAAYPYLPQHGSWDNLFLFRNGRWDAALCRVMPLTCRLLVPELPTQPGVPWVVANNEEVVIFRTRPGTHVGHHCGASNGQVNLHLTLAGGLGARLWVQGQQHVLRDGRALCFQDSFMHSLDHHSGIDRYSLVVRVMHPEMGLGYPSRRTNVVDLDASSVNSALMDEIERLREAYRALVRESDLSHTCGQTS